MTWRELLGRILRLITPHLPSAYMADTAWIEQPEAYDFSTWPALTNHEMEVAWYIRQGYSNDQIAAELTISKSIAKTHVHNLLVKFNVRSRWVLKDVLEAADFNPWGDPPAA